jgi:hypothetical protein
MTEVLRLQADPETESEESPGGVPFAGTSTQSLDTCGRPPA